MKSDANFLWHSFTNPHTLKLAELVRVLLLLKYGFLSTYISEFARIFERLL